MNKFELFRVYGGSRGIAPEHYHKQFRKLLSEHHPDKGGSAGNFMQVKEHRRLLGTEAGREDLDTYFQIYGSVCSVCSGKGFLNKGWSGTRIHCDTCGGCGYTQNRCSPALAVEQ